MNFTNNTGQGLSDFLLKINFNLFGVQVEEQLPSSFYVADGSTMEAKIKCSILKGNINA